MTHGEFGKSLVESAKMIAGEIENVTILSLHREDSPENYFKRAVEETKNFVGETICLVDLFGGSPCNTALRLSQTMDMKIIAGLNLPLFIELYSQITGGSENLDELIKITRENVFDVTKKFEDQKKTL